MPGCWGMTAPPAAIVIIRAILNQNLRKPQKVPGLVLFAAMYMKGILFLMIFFVLSANTIRLISRKTKLDLFFFMEYMDYTLEKYIDKNNSRLCYSERKNIVRQILNAFDYIHYKKRLHRDISPRNILIKEYEHTLVVKIADFGLIKTPESGLTTVNTEFKGYFNDPSLVIDGFDKYDMSHETYALTRIVYYVMTGKTTIDNNKFANLKTFIEKGLNPNREMRFKNVAEMMRAFHNI